MKPRILLLIPNMDFGGAQRVFYNLSQGLTDRFEVIECVFNLKTPRAFPLVNELIDLNIPGGKTIFEKAYRFFQRCYKVYKVKKQYGIDLTISHLEGADYVNYFSGGNIITCVHGSKIYDQNIKGMIGWFRKYIMIPFVYKRVGRIVVVNRGIKQELIDYFGCGAERITVINNGLDAQHILAQSKDRLDKPEEVFFQNHKIVISHARLVAEKNHTLLLKVFANNEIRPRAKLVIIGDGPYREKLFETCSILKLAYYDVWRKDQPWSESYDVYFLGYHTNSFKYLSKAWLYVLPSKYEGYPMALCEALICNLPVIAADCHHGPRDILQVPEAVTGNGDVEIGKYGILIGTYDPVVWTKTILAVLNKEIPINVFKEDDAKRTDLFSMKIFNEEWQWEILKVFQVSTNSQSKAKKNSNFEP